MKKRTLLLMLTAALAGMSVNAGVLRVSKTESADFTTIQKAVDAAKENDTILIVDKGVYEEQVTFDSTKRGIVLQSKNSADQQKPVIRYQDNVDVGPRNSEEAKVDSKITFYKNGALRFIKAQKIRIEGIVIDGGGTFPFGAKNVWDGGGGQLWPMQHGNAAVDIVSSAEIILRHCEIQNAYIGCYVTEVGIDGFFCTIAPSDGVILDPYSNCKPLSSGNHLIEYNRIHSNSFGLFFENALDMGSTVRHNLIYENHHQSEEIAKKIGELTSEGSNLIGGGAFLFKNDLLSPLAVYNNTFWHNRFMFEGVWKAGGQHLLFNNIFGKPDVYSNAGSNLEMTKCLANRMHNCVFAAQAQAPTASYISVLNDLPQPKAEGDLISGGLKPFPESAEIRYLETPFISTDPESPDFLVPDWSNALVQSCIVDKGWEPSGVKDPDGSRADLGAIPKGKGTFEEITTIRPAAPVEVIGDKARLSFYVETKIGECKNAKATLFGLVRDLDTSDVFGNAYKAIPAISILSIPLPLYDVVSGGKNTIEIPAAELLGNYAFFEMIVEGTGSSGKSYTSAVGFIPYRTSVPIVTIDIMDLEKTKKISEVEGGVPFTVRVSILARNTGTILEKPVPSVSLYTHSGTKLLTSDGTVLDTLPNTIVGVAEFTVKFPVTTIATIENVIASGRPKPEEYFAAFIGSSTDVKVLPKGGSAVLPHIKQTVSSNLLRYEIIDLNGRAVYHGVNKTASPDMLMQSTGTMVAKGVYILRMTDMIDGNVVVKQKFMTGK